MKVRDILQIGRIHTASLTMPSVALGYLIGGGRWNDPLMAFWIIFAVLFHYQGFLLNNILDLPYDRKDASKAHFALVAGRVSVTLAWKIEIVSMFVGGVLIPLLSWGRPLAALVGVAAIILGVIYNAVSKRSVLSPILITASFVSLFFFPYLTTMGLRMDLALAVALFGMLGMLFQIAYEGYLKDLEVDKLNLLGMLGARVEDGVFTPERGLIVGLPLRLLLCFVSLAVVFEARTRDILALLLTLFLIVALMFYSGALMMKQVWRRDVVVRRCALSEIVAYFTLVASLQGFLGWVGVTLFVCLPMLWFIVWNRVLWGTNILPRV